MRDLYCLDLGRQEERIPGRTSRKRTNIERARTNQISIYKIKDIPVVKNSMKSLNITYYCLVYEFT